MKFGSRMRAGRGQPIEAVVADRGLDRRVSSVRQSGSSRSSADRVDHRAGEDVRADLGALLHDDDGDVGGALLEADGRRKPGGAGADDHDIEFHRLARRQFTVGHGLSLTAAESVNSSRFAPLFHVCRHAAIAARRAIVWTDNDDDRPRQGHARTARLLSGGGRRHGHRRNAGRPVGRAAAVRRSAACAAGASAARAARDAGPHAHAARPRDQRSRGARPRPTPR